ncbi:hypothetical protein HGRIS_013582 [Hohenbuehelia grisea]|uniref:Meiotically up-regulated gene 190 protein n=1 Tax=Hohenbuehelia grisea TaxID=104357 RepID=A0ABR3IW47_9AGAR
MPDDHQGPLHEVTDPITHLPVQIHDYTEVDLEQIPPINQHDQPPSQSQPRDENRTETNDERHEAVDTRLLDETQKGRWVDPKGERSRTTVHAGIVAGISSFGAAMVTALFSGKLFSSSGTSPDAPQNRGVLNLGLSAGKGLLSLVFQIFNCLILAVVIASATTIIVKPKTPRTAAEPKEVERFSKSKPGHEKRREQSENETRQQDDQTTWLNAVLVTLWPIINPTLFTPLADILEDSLQASLPTFVKAVKVGDIAQGIDPVRVSGIRWLDSKRAERAPAKAQNDPDKGTASQGQDNAEQEEAGEYVCLELGLVYRAPLDSKGKTHTATASPESRARNPHLVLHLWTIAGIQVPFYISLHGLLCTARVRIAMTPNPPFAGMSTLTLLGVPHVSFSLTPLSRHLPNVMDVPVLSNWVQDAITAALQEYVAPRSVSIDLGLMLGGGERVDVEGAGIIIVTVRSAYGFRDGDAMKVWNHLNKNRAARKGDAYVVVGWSKWGKPLWSTRIIEDEEKPTWNETAYLVVSPAELNAHELLQLQLWDADRTSADDNLGNVEVDLRDLMNNEESLNRMARREDSLTELDGKTSCPGTIEWEVGYFPKIGLGQWVAAMAEQKLRSESRTTLGGDEEPKRQQLDDAQFDHNQEHADDDDANKAKTKEDKEAEQQALEELRADNGDGDSELKDKTDEIISSLPPPPDWPSGILSIRVEQIDGLEVEKVRASGDDAVRDMEGEADSGDEGGGGDDKVPSPYCVIMINHERVYKTRTKMVTGKPYFDAGTERFIKDWQHTSVMISVRDSRLHEVDPLLGIVDLPLPVLFKNRSHLTESFPLVGGIGYGRVRIAATFRSVQSRLPRELLGWDTGTIEIMPHAQGDGPLPDELRSCRIVMRTDYGKAKFIPHDGTEHGDAWESKRGRSAKLAVRKRYASCLTLQFRKHVLWPDPTPAFCVLWLKDVPDDEEVDITLPIIRNSPSGSLERARLNAAEGIGEAIEGASLKLRVRFWPGLSGYHKKLAKKDKGIADVMESLDCAEDSRGFASDGLFDDELSESGSSSASSDDEDSRTVEGNKEAAREDDGNRGVLDQAKHFKKRRGQLHRKHRGLMQWSGARKMKWAVKQAEEKVGTLKDKAKNRVVHRQKETKMEKEV